MDARKTITLTPSRLSIARGLVRRPRLVERPLTDDGTFLLDLGGRRAHLGGRSAQRIWVRAAGQHSPPEMPAAGGRGPVGKKK